jgi:hypothetical protein
MQFSELSEEARVTASGVVRDKYSDESMDATYEQAADDVTGYARDLGLTLTNFQPGEFCMNFDIPSRPYGDAAEGEGIEFPIDNYVKELFNDQLIPLSVAELIGSCRKFALLSNAPDSSECEKDNARLTVIRELAKVYHDFVASDKEFMETNAWGQMFADANGMMFDADGNDATKLLTRHIIENVITY